MSLHLIKVKHLIMKTIHNMAHIYIVKFLIAQLSQILVKIKAYFYNYTVFFNLHK